MARSLVWVLRGLAFLAAFWGLFQIGNAAEAARIAAVVSAASLVTVLLALAEGLRLCIIIEGNTRRAGESRTGARGQRLPKQEGETR